MVGASAWWELQLDPVRWELLHSKMLHHGENALDDLMTQAEAPSGWLAACGDRITEQQRNQRDAVLPGEKRWPDLDSFPPDDWEGETVDAFPPDDWWSWKRLD